MKVISNLLL